MNPAFQTMLQQARSDAQVGNFPAVLARGREMAASAQASVDELLETGALLHNCGFLFPARECFARAGAMAPADVRALANLANVAKDAGDHGTASHLYAELRARLPNNPVIRRNALTSLEYDPAVSEAERRRQALAWGEWASELAGGPVARPPLASPAGRPLRLGYVSADFCQHTVGLFVKGVLQAHDRGRVAVYAYSAGGVEDRVTEEIRATCQFRAVGRLDDAALADLIRQDEIDVLIDLSGHTGGSRLTVFAHRPAPVLVSWLGYFATTGLPCLDAVLLDEWHAPPGTEAAFVEPIIRLPRGRLCYQPVPFAPEVAPSPCLERGYVTFGSFNNSAKYNDEVFDLWAAILRAVPTSRLVLKWRTFNDEAYCQSVREAFARRGVAAERLDLRPPSFHAEVLRQYGDLDIALDPFPFTGGLTSCEALWMGVPVVTWPRQRVVSRQTLAFLHQIGLPELAAGEADDYVRTAVALAENAGRLQELRGTLRERMRGSALMDVAGFARQLEDSLINLYQHIFEEQSAMTVKTVLHVGPGHRLSGARLPACFEGWKEIRLDIDPANEPDILGTMLDMSAVESGSVDAIYSAHTIEHLYPNEIPTALAEFQRVLKADGFAVINCPDLQEAARMIAEDRLLETAYNSPAGPVTPFDIVFSHRMFTRRDNPYMAHHSGFTLSTLSGTLQQGGFATVAGKRRPAAFDLWVLATKQAMDEAAIRELAGQVLPA